MTLPAPEAVSEFLSSMGRTPDEVYEWLKTRGFTGNHMPRHCPIAMALREEFPELNSDDNWAFTGYSLGTMTDHWSTVVTAPESIYRFAHAFDNERAYQDLYNPQSA